MRSLLFWALLAAGAMSGCASHEAPAGPRLDDASASRCPCCTVPNCKCGECKDSGGCPCPPSSPPKESNPRPSEPAGPTPGGLSPN